MLIERGWFYLADLNPRRGTEPGKTRPVLVIQTNFLNQIGHPSTIIIPVTTKIQSDAEPLRIRIPATSKGFKVDSDLMVDQIRAIDNRRLYKQNNDQLIKKIARVDEKIMKRVEECLKIICDVY